MPSTHVKLFKFSVASPADTSPIDRLREAGYDASKIVCVAGKSEGNGCVNDFSRTLSALVWETVIPATSVSVFSGGTEGVLSPHVTLLVEEKSTGLIAAVGRTRVLKPSEVGSATQAEEVAKSVRQLLAESDISPENVHLVLVKCPLLTSSKMESIRRLGETACASDTYESMGKSRYSTALGIAVALGELAESSIPAALADENVWSSKASCSSGAELDDCHILVLASPPSPKGFKLRAVSTFMKDAIDAQAVQSLLEKVKEDNGKVLQVFAKAEASPDGLVRGKRHTMLTDSDLHSTRHARAAVGGLIAGLTGQPDLYVSGGAEGQGPPGGGSLCVIYEV
ncbi:cyanuric acid hydrolase [Meredithblackwellia eburnea MCA 4105]